MPPILGYTHRRPNSAVTSSSTRYDLSTKQYRIPQPQIFNRIKNSINKTFAVNNSAAYTDIVQLTKSSNSVFKNKIDQICTKYCIKPKTKNKQNNFSSLSVNFIDADNIAKSFFRRKSHQKQSLERKNYLNQQIKQSTSKVRISAKKIKTQQFFKLTCENLKKLQKKDKEHKRNNFYSSNQQKNTDIQSKNDSHDDKNKNIKRRQSSTKSTSSRYSSRQNFNINKNKSQQQTSNFHPYLKIYQQSQKQALELILNQNTLNLNYNDVYPVQMNDIEEWEKYQKNVKDIYSGIKRMRYVHSSREMAKTGRIRAQSTMQRQRQDQNQTNGFYIT